MEADKDGDGKLSFEEFAEVVAKTVRETLLPDVSSHSNITLLSGYRKANVAGAHVLNNRLWPLSSSIPFSLSILTSLRSLVLCLVSDLLITMYCNITISTGTCAALRRFC